jgi:hypothetical protein
MIGDVGKYRKATATKHGTIHYEKRGIHIEPAAPNR